MKDIEGWNTSVFVVYPHKGYIPEETLMTWAADALANDETDEKAETLADAVRILDDLGTITTAKERGRGDIYRRERCADQLADN